MSSPFNKILPLVGVSKPAIIRSVVVLPQPEGPKKVTNSPFVMSRLKLSTTVTPPNDLLTPSSDIMTLSSITAPNLS